MINAIPYILATMIIWDFSLHVFDTLHFFNKTKVKHPFGLWILLDYLAGDDAHKRRQAYNIFWTIYWGIASILILIFLYN